MQSMAFRLSSRREFSVCHVLASEALGYFVDRSLVNVTTGGALCPAGTDVRVGRGGRELRLAAEAPIEDRGWKQ